MSFRLAIIVSCNPFNFVNVCSLQRTLWCKEYALTKLNGLLLTNTCMASRNDIYSSSILAEKKTFWALTLSQKMCCRKQFTEQKLLILVSFFSGEDPHPLYQLLYQHITVSMLFHFYWATLYNGMCWRITPCLNLVSLQYTSHCMKKSDSISCINRNLKKKIKVLWKLF